MKFFADLGRGIKAVFKGPASKDNLFNLDYRTSLREAIPFGLQHVLAMFAANIMPIVIVFTTIGLFGSEFAIHSMLGAIFMAGLGTIIQLFIGARLPVVTGTSFTFLPVLLTIGTSENCLGNPEVAYYTIMGSIIFGSLFAVAFSLLYRFWGKLIKPIVPAIVVLGVGLSLLGSGANWFLGGDGIIKSIITTGETGTGVPYFCYIIVAFVTLITALLWSIFMTGIWKNLNIVVAIALGYIVSCCIPGMVNFDSMVATEIIGPHGIIDYPHLINLTKVRFELVPCILVSVCFIATIVEAIGNTVTVAKSGLEREATLRDINGGLICYGINGAIGALFGTFPVTIYAQNVGIVAQNKVVNRFSFFIGALFLLIASFFPPVAHFIYSIPDAVIGGTMVILLGTIAVVGMKSISEVGWTDKNILITAISVCLGFGITVANISLGTNDVALSVNIFRSLGIGWLSDLLANNVLNMFIISFILSWVLPDSMHLSFFHRKRKKEG